MHRSLNDFVGPLAPEDLGTAVLNTCQGRGCNSTSSEIPDMHMHAYHCIEPIKFPASLYVDCR